MEDTILGESKLVAFVPTTEPAKARVFFEGVLGLRLVEDEAPYALVFDANGTMLRVTTVPQHEAAPFTVLGWAVEDIDAVVARLAAAGVPMLRYEGLNDKNPDGIWTSPHGVRVGWFHDPNENVLSITQF
jgi:catechol 2,3-dioxygenase-like lactoylglutathione lyase family enzyme